MTERRLVTSGGRWEAAAGYSRAVVIGDMCWVAGTTDAGPDGHSLHPGDVAGQTRSILGIIDRALEAAGFQFADIVRTRMFVTDISRSAEVLTIHGSAFEQIRPASTIVEVGALIHPSLLIEIEVDAHRG